METNKKGFTLIELLVVVLIIGILAAIALPQYQKVIEKSKAAQALPILKSVMQSSQMYYLVNGNYPSEFDQMDVDITWSGNEKFLSQAVDTKSDGTWSLQIENSTDYIVLHIGRISGKYKGAGFFVVFKSTAQSSVNENDIRCFERKTSANFTFDSNLPEGAYCEGVIGGTYISEDSWVRVYMLP